MSNPEERYQRELDQYYRDVRHNRAMSDCVDECSRKIRLLEEKLDRLAKALKESHQYRNQSQSSMKKKVKQIPDGDFYGDHRNRVNDSLCQSDYEIHQMYTTDFYRKIQEPIEEKQRSLEQQKSQEIDQKQRCSRSMRRLHYPTRP